MTAIQRFWDWWTGELADIFDNRGPQTMLALEVSSDEVALINRQNGRRITDAQVDAPDWPDRLEAMRETAIRLDRDPPTVEMMLPREQTLFSEEVFSMDAARNLRAAALERADRLSEHGAEELEVDVSPPRLPEPDGSVIVVLAVTPKQTLEEAKNYAARWGFNLSRITAAEQSSDFPLGPTFYEAPRRGGGIGILRGLCAILLIVLAGLLGGAAWRAVETRSALASESLAELDGGADRVREARERADMVDRYGRDAGYPTLLRRSNPPVWRLTAAAASALPEGVWLDALRIQDGALQLVGRAEALDGVLQSIDASAYFGAARRNSTQAAPGGGAAFVIDATINDVGGR